VAVGEKLAHGILGKMVGLNRRPLDNKEKSAPENEGGVGYVLSSRGSESARGRGRRGKGRA